MRRNITIILTMLLLSAGASETPRFATRAQRPPNFVIFFVDDMGYADIGSFGAKGYTTPNLDRMAREGIRLTSFYAAQAVCSASRVALLTGCYSNRVSVTGGLFPPDTTSIHSNETTIAEICKSREYRTEIFGKWHLGHLPQFLPTKHGFDEYLGIPYSNDMWPPNTRNNFNFPALPLIEKDKSIKEVDAAGQAQLTTLLTERAVKFIERNRANPFFVYIPHPQPHVPLF